MITSFLALIRSDLPEDVGCMLRGDPAFHLQKLEAGWQNGVWSRMERTELAVSYCLAMSDLFMQLLNLHHGGTIRTLVTSTGRYCPLIAPLWSPYTQGGRCVFSPRRFDRQRQEQTKSDFAAEKRIGYITMLETQLNREHITTC